MNPQVFDVLTHAANETEIVSVQLRDGQRFRDGVLEVFSACGAKYVIFHAHNRMNVDDIVCCEPVPAALDAVP